MSRKTIGCQEAPVCIVGPNNLLNKMLSALIENDGEFQCVCRPSLGLKDKQALHKNPLFLFDCYHNDFSTIETQLGLGTKAATPRPYAALFNVKPDGRFEKESFFKGFRGVFYVSDPPEMFPQGVRKMIEGERWYTRKVLSECAETLGRPARPSGKEMCGLTRREKEILLRVAEGKRNRDIAEELFISPHTVKTHVHNIFKKIETPNRFQAALWATNHLFHL